MYWTSKAFTTSCGSSSGTLFGEPKLEPRIEEPEVEIRTPAVIRDLFQCQSPAVVTS